MAINEFKKQFKAKTGVSWEERVGMTTRKGDPFHNVVSANSKSALKANTHGLVVFMFHCFGSEY